MNAFNSYLNTAKGRTYAGENRAEGREQGWKT
jgi:hypothetical protein